MAAQVLESTSSDVLFLAKRVGEKQNKSSPGGETVRGKVFVLPQPSNTGHARSLQLQENTTGHPRILIYKESKLSNCFQLITVHGSSCSYNSNMFTH